MRAYGALLAVLALSACATGSDEPLAPAAEIPARAPGDAAAGRAAFEAACAACHASRDGFDLAYFAFPDSTIVRRAVFHVDSATARDIAAHVRALAPPVASRGARLFQPDGIVLTGDVEFAVALFGSDAWPEGLTSEALRAIDPLSVAVAVGFPRWSVEHDNVDWMPGEPLPESVLDHGGGAVRRALDRYYASPSTERVRAAVAALRLADRDPRASNAPCGREGGEGPLFDPARCFEVRRWTATLAAQHMLRLGLTGRLDAVLHDTWWDVGNAARLATRFDGATVNGVTNWASWMLLGWAFEPARHASVYTGGGLVRSGLLRHATFVALRSAVARPPGSGAIFADVAAAARFAPPHWAFGATRFGYAHLLERLEAGPRPARAEALEEARLQVRSAYAAAAAKVTPAQREELARLRDRILALLS